MYYPKSQIQTGFYSNGELVEFNSLRPYTGPYFNTSDGRSYTGKTLNDGPNLGSSFSHSPPSSKS